MQTNQNITQKAEQELQQEVLANQSGLVWMLMQDEVAGFDWEHVRNQEQPFEAEDEEASCTLCEQVGPVNKDRICDPCFRPNKEIREWWAITGNLYRRLDSIGEPVLRNSYGYWWGRTGTGDDLLADGVFQKIALGEAAERTSEVHA